jgi:succinate dehydrogenase subunit C
MAEQVKRKPYVREISPTRWFFRDRRYLRYMAREVTCIFIGAYTLLLLVGIARLTEGPVAYEAFLGALREPASVVFQLVTLAFALYHTTTWFNVTPKALPIQVGEAFVPGGVVAGVHYAVWALLSVAVLFLAGVF